MMSCVPNELPSTLFTVANIYLADYLSAHSGQEPGRVGLAIMRWQAGAPIVAVHNNHETVQIDITISLLFPAVCCYQSPQTRGSSR